MDRQHVLVVEDDPSVADFLAALLEGQGFNVSVTHSALGAAGMVRQLQPRVILLELALPYRSGASLLAELKGDPSTAHVPVLVVTGMPELLGGRRRGMAAALIEKPIDADALLGAVRDAGPVAV